MKPDTRSPLLKWTDRIVAVAIIAAVVIYIVWAYKNNYAGMREVLDAR